jgi:hypothetical protein
MGLALTMEQERDGLGRNLITASDRFGSRFEYDLLLAPEIFVVFVGFATSEWEREAV